MLKHIGGIVAATLVASSCLFAQGALSGISAMDNSPKTETLKTSAETFTTKAGTKVERYKSGAVKYFFIEGKQSIKTPAGIFDVETPINTRETRSSVKTQPIEFYENGALKAFYLYGVNVPGERSKQIGTPIGNVKCKTQAPIEFYENGKLKSFYIVEKQTAKFLTNLDPKAEFLSGSKVEFFDDGKIRAFTPTVALKLKFPLGVKMMPKTRVAFNKEGAAIRVVPEKGTRLNVGNGNVILLQNGRPLELYESGTIKEMSWEYSDMSFELSGVKFYSNNDGKFHKVTLRFYEGEKIKEVEASAERDAFGMSEQEGNPFVTEVEGKTVEVQRLCFDEKGRLEFVDYGKPALELSSKKIGNKTTGEGVETVAAIRIYYKDGKRIAGVGLRSEKYKMGFYNSASGCIFLFDGEKLTKTIPVAEKEFFMECEIFFDEKGNPVEYSVIGPDDDIWVKKI